MSDKSIDQLLQRYFPFSQNNDWEKIAETELKAGNALQKLSWTGKDGNLFLPYYDAADVAGIGYLKKFGLRQHASTLPGDRAWFNLPALLIDGEKACNKLALNLLSGGADGIIFNLLHKTNPDLSVLLDNIVWPYCNISFISADPGFPAQLSAYIQKQYDPAALQGALFWDTVPKISNMDYLLRECTRFYPMGLLVPPGTPAAEISDALWTGVKTIDAWHTASGRERMFRSIAFSLPAGPDLPATIVKFKALRLLWFQVAQSYGHNDYMPGDLHLHARVGAQTADPGNLVHATFSAMAAVMGGCNALSIQAPDNHPSYLRLASNISTILREESSFHSEADPMAGAYALDAMVDTVARHAWKIFQQKCEAL